MRKSSAKAAAPFSKEKVKEAEVFLKLRENIRRKLTNAQKDRKSFARFTKTDISAHAEFSRIQTPLSAKPAERTATP